MTGPLQPWRPEDFDERCETCGAPPGRLCKPSCDTGYTAEDARGDADRRQEAAPAPSHRPVPDPSPSHPKE
ncbi:hypothetical protein ABZ468_41620 [Streptomyces sp. NPDC005708]|uniref:hypothetical protein n=1 Tax=Streptomyces sp. NPDC005708 TaxID=3154564 RepID=UPI0033FD74B4